MQKRILFFVFTLLFTTQTVIAKTSNDTLISEQNYLPQIKAFDAWEYTTGSSSVIVAVVDTGVDIDHPDLKNNIWINNGEIDGDGLDNDNNGYIDDIHGWDFIENMPDPRPKIGAQYNAGAVSHGTLVAGIIGAEGNNIQGVSGINWDVSIMSLRVLDHQGSGNSLIVREALQYAINNGADVINFSFVGTSLDNRFADLIAEAHSKGIAVVSAAGNEGDDHTVSDLNLIPHYPICHTGTIGVAGVDALDKKASYSNFGRQCIDIAAPGSRIMTTSFFQPALPEFRSFYTDMWSGTSFSAPMVSGAIALLKSFLPNEKATHLAEVLIETTDTIDAVNPSFAGELGSGRINISNAFTALRSATKTVAIKEPQRIVLPRISTLSAKGDISSYATWSRSGESQISQNLPFPFTFETMAIVDIDNDRVMEIIVGSVSGEKPHVTIYNTVTGEKELQFLAYDETFRGGVRVSVGDVDGNGFIDILTVPASEGTAHVRVFDGNGNAYIEFIGEDSSQGGSYAVSALALPSGKSDILINKSGSDLLLRYNASGGLVSSFFAGHPSSAEGLFIVTGDVNGDAVPEILLSARKGTPLVRVLDINGHVLSAFMAYAEKFRGGVSVGIKDATGDGLNNIITGAGPTGGPHVRTFNLRGELLGQFFADKETYTGGVIISE